MITLQYIKAHGLTQKKMLHIPSLSLYNIQEIPILSMNRAEIKELLEDWK